MSATASDELRALVFLVIALTVLAFTPLLYFLPKATLAAIIVVAVANLIDMKTFRETWVYNKADTASLIATFIAVLTLVSNQR